ncbi:MAG: hypothetical protein FWD75_11530, partial [Propionibacteriaceae bacterium]|nr:hypothetical protein [Propionibacteriaceae bacterium]
MTWLVIAMACLLGVAGCTRSYVDPAVQVYGSVRDLADASWVVVVGTPVASHVEAGDDSHADTMVTTVDVEQVVKSRPGFNVGGTVVVSQPVGATVDDYPPVLVHGSRYLLYLVGDDTQSTVMFMVGGAAGQWIGVEQSDPGVFVQVRSDPLNDLPRSLTVDAALG